MLDYSTTDYEIATTCQAHSSETHTKSLPRDSIHKALWALSFDDWRVKIYLLTFWDHDDSFNQMLTRFHHLN